MGEPIRILISSCLLGEKVRYDGGHKREGYLVGTLGRFVEWIPVCPEVDCGLPTPREAMRLVGDPESPRLVTSKGGVDQTERMTAWARKKLEELERIDLCGYICKKDSPSSGMERVKVYGDSGIPAKVGSGVFTRAFMEHFPLIPVEEEGRLNDPILREMFIGRVFTLRRSFHTDHKLLLLSHDRKRYSEMGRLVAAAKELTPSDLYDQYRNLLMEALSAKPTVKKSADVLLHMMGHFKKVLSADEKQELLEVITRYREKLIPLIVPVTLIGHYVRKYRVSYTSSGRSFSRPTPSS
jgi:uncharacterized protein YbbK (DUF523 family)/uncharacterized protein YbgA (DUF1722 family)